MSDPVVIHTKEYYDRLKEIEGRHWWTLGMTDLMDVLLAGRLPERDGACLLDVGCGSGIGLAWAARRLPRARRVGVDVSPHGIEHCRGLGAELHVAGAESLPLDAASVDLAICIDVLQHLEDDRQAVREMARVLRPGGLVYLRTNALGLAPPPPGSRLYTRALLRRLLGDSALEVLRCSRVNFVGSLVGEAARILHRGPAGHGSGDGHHHGNGHHHHDPAHTDPHGPGPIGRFEGGGYGGGLRLAAESGTSPVQRLKRLVLRAEGHIVRAGLVLPFGHSLVALARKPDRE